MNLPVILHRFSRYFITGGFAAIIDLGLFLLLVHLTGSVLLAAAVSFVVAITINFLLSARFAFSARRTLDRYAIFALGASLGLVINAGVTVQVERLDWVPLAFAKVAGIAVAFGFNFLFNHFVTFSRFRSS